jgi:hypothetical protein
MIHVVAMNCLIDFPLLIHIELLLRSRSFKNGGVGVGSLKIEESDSESELLCTNSTALKFRTIETKNFYGSGFVRCGRRCFSAE